MIIYFTGTGNSRFVAKRLAGLLEDKVESINDYLKASKKGSFDSEKPFVFVTPSHMSRMPLVVERFLTDSTFTGSKDAYFIFTAGEAIGNAHRYCRRLCSQKGMTYRGTAAVGMPASYVVMYDVMPREDAMNNAQSVIPLLESMAGSIRSGSSLETDPSFSGHKSFSAMAPMASALMIRSKPFHTNGTCIGCGHCEDACPLNNIRVSDGVPVWGDRCMHCMACISSCPKKAIDYGKKTQGRNRYYLDAELDEGRS